MATVNFERLSDTGFIDSLVELVIYNNASIFLNRSKEGWVWKSVWNFYLVFENAHLVLIKNTATHIGN